MIPPSVEKGKKENIKFYEIRYNYSSEGNIGNTAQRSSRI